MKLSDRDKNLALVLPAIVVLVVYGVFFLRGKLAEQSQAARQLEAARSAAPPPEALEEQGRQVDLLKKLRADLQTQMHDTKSRWQALVAACTTPVGRNERVARLTRLMSDNKLDLLEDRNADTGQDVKLSPALERLTERMRELSAGQKPDLRRLRFHGRYSDVHQLLQELSQGDVVAIPVGLTMKTNADRERREWTLLVWI